LPKEDYEGKTVIWPSYIDSQVPRSRGRKVSLSHAVPAPTVDEIVRAAGLGTQWLRRSRTPACGTRRGRGS